MKVRLSVACPDAELNVGGVLLVKGNDYEDIYESPELLRAIDLGIVETLEEKKGDNSGEVALKEGEEVVVFAEQRDGKISRVVFELLSKARELADKLNVKVGAVLLCEGDGGKSSELISYGADIVYVCESSFLKDYQTDIYTKALKGFIEKAKPQPLIFFSLKPLVISLSWKALTLFLKKGL